MQNQCDFDIFCWFRPMVVIEVPFLMLKDIHEEEFERWARQRRYLYFCALHAGIPSDRK